MKTAIFYKEWLKTRYFFVLASLVSWGFIAYCLLKIRYIIHLKGAAHLWQVMMERDAVFIERLTYLPLIFGILFGIVQFIPEMQQKRLKLTLHLPYPQYRTITLMLCWGAGCLLSCFLTHFLILWLYLRTILPVELYSHILLTATPWYLAGILSYIFTSWICLEPTWKRRIANLFVSVAVTSVFFLSSTPEAYNCMLIPAAIYAIFCFSLPLLSIQRFLAGKQD